MFIPDMPNVPPQDVPVMIAQANQAQSGDTTRIRTVGVCSPSPNHNYSLDNVVIPITSAGNYLESFEYRTPPASATAAILQAPKHGVLRLVTEADRGTLFDSGAGPLKPDANLYAYLPDSSYVGNDTAIIQVDFGNGLKVNVKYYFQAINRGGLSGDWMDIYCSKKGVYWKISSTLDADGNSTITSVEYQSPVASTADTVLTNDSLSSWLSLAQLDAKIADISGINNTFADLTGAALGQTVGSNITLDTNAAGYNWFIDTTPTDNSEYLPTSNPNEWVAKEGTDAYGKMDMLSVLLHEYGHALGIDHSADNHDYMATTLTPGVRRMPSADEMALMQQLVAQAKGEMTATASTLSPTLPLQGGGGFPTLPLGTSFIGFLGLLRSTRYGGVSIAPDASTLVTKYAVAANATFTNLNTAGGWNTQGSVDIASGVAKLSEVSTSQTRLSQVFMLNEQDRYLSFTLSGAALDDLNGAPSPLSNFPPQAGERANVAASGSGS